VNENNELSGFQSVQQLPRLGSLRVSVIDLSESVCVFSFPCDFAVYAWDIDSAKLARVHRFQRKAMTALAVSSGFYATGSADSTVVVWDTINHEQHFCLSKHKSPVNCLALHETADLLVSCSKEGLIVTSTIKEGLFLKSAPGPEEPKRVVISSKGKIYIQYEFNIIGFDRNLSQLGNKVFESPICTYVIVEDFVGKEWLIVSLMGKTILAISLPEFEVLWKQNFAFQVIAMKACEMEVAMGTAEGQVMVLSFT
jgi:WD40 repeat protein